MNEQQQLIKDTLDRLLADLCTQSIIDAAEAGTFPQALWDALVETGLTVAGLPEEAGGAGGEIGDSMLVMRQAGKFAAPVPLAEHFIAGLLLSECGASLPAEPVTVADGQFTLTGETLSGRAENVAFASWCRYIVAIAGDKLCLVDLSNCSIAPGRNIAGEPRDAVSIDTKPDAVFDYGPDIIERLRLLGAATRASLMAGALESVLEMSVQYSMERSQFGRPISKFQAIQQQLATLAGEVAASTMAAQVIDSLDPIDVAIAKARIGEAVTPSADIAHQVHGAMGYTMEHSLNHRTRRLWSWRDEYGNERFWQIKVGRSLVAEGGDGLWNAVTSRG